MKYRRLGQTNLEVSAVCMGCWSISTKDFFWDHQARGDSIAAVQAALDAGINFFDTAPAYGDGDSEKILGEALGSRRKDAVIATKVGAADLNPAMIRQRCEESLHALRTDYIDLYQVHWPNAAFPLAATFETLQALQAEGKVRAIGISNFGVSYLTELLGIGCPASNQLPYSLLWRAVEYEIAPLCAAHDIGILCYCPLCQGLLTGKFAAADEVPEKRGRNRLFSNDRPLSRHGEPGCEDAAFAALREIRRIADDVGQPMGAVSVAWLLRQPAVNSVVVGARNAKQATENALAGDLELSDDVVQRLSEVSEAVKAHIGPNADMWEHISRMERH